MQLVIWTQMSKPLSISFSCSTLSSKIIVLNITCKMFLFQERSSEFQTLSHKTNDGNMYVFNKLMIFPCWWIKNSHKYTAGLKCKAVLVILSNKKKRRLKNSISDKFIWKMNKPAIPLLRIYPKDLKVRSWRDIQIPVFIAALFIHNSQKGKQSKCPSTNEWISKMRSSNANIIQL